VSCLGWALLGGGGFLLGWRAWRGGRLRARVSFAIAGLTVVVLVGLGVLTSRQLRVWHDSETLWSYTLSTDPRSAMALNNLGRILFEKGAFGEAAEHFEKALERNPDFAEAHTNLGLLLARQGKLLEAVEHYREALEIKPTLSEARGNLDAALRRMGK